MSRVNVEIELPDTLATQAKKAGLLEPEALERMVREAKEVRDGRPVLITNCRSGEGIEAVVDAISRDVLFRK